MNENRRFEVYTNQRGEQWTAKQITRHRKKINQERRRVMESKGKTLHIRRRPNGEKSGYTNADLSNAPRK